EKRLYRLAAQRAAGFVGHSSRNHERNFLAGFFDGFVDGKERRLGVERVENGLDDQKIDTAFKQRFRLIEISLTKLIERDSAESRIVYVGRDRPGDGEGTHRSRNEPALTRFVCDLVCGASRDLRRRKIHFLHERAKIDIVHHALKEFLVLATASRFSGKQKIVQPNRGRAEG